MRADFEHPSIVHDSNFFESVAFGAKSFDEEIDGRISFKKACSKFELLPLESQAFHPPSLFRRSATMCTLHHKKTHVLAREKRRKGRAPRVERALSVPPTAHVATAGMVVI